MEHGPVPTEGRATARQILAWVVLLVAVLALYIRGVGSFQVGVYQDDAMYLVLSHSIASGGEYGLVNGPGPPLPSKYPFVFPLLLSPFARWLPDAGAVQGGPRTDLLAATAVPLLATLVNLSLLFWGWPLLSRTSRWWGLGVAWMHGLSPMVTGHARIVMSEPVFTTFVLVALLLTERCARDRTRPWLFLGLGTAVAAAVFTRTIGVTLAAAVCVRLGVVDRRAWRGHEAARRLGFATLGAVAFIGVVVATTSVRLRDLPQRGYVDEIVARKGESGNVVDRGAFTAQIQRVGLGYLLDGVRSVVVPVGGGDRTRDLARQIGIPEGPTWIGVAVVLIVAVGIWRAIGGRFLSPACLLFEAAYFAAILLWPWNESRYLYPIQALLQFQFLLGLAHLGALGRRIETSVPAQGSGRLAAAVCLALVLVSAWKSLDVEDSRDSVRDLSLGADWLARHAPRDAVVMARYPEAIYLYSGRRTVDLATAAALRNFEGVDYVLVGPRLIWGSAASPVYGAEEDALLAALGEMAASGRAQLVYESPPRDRVVVYALRRSAEAAESRSSLAR